MDNLDGQAYLNQISASNRPVAGNQSKLQKILSSVYFKVGAAGLAALIVIMIIGSALGGGNVGPKDQMGILKLRLDRTMSVMQDYQSQIKSSNLRSSSASLYSVLANTNTQLTLYLTENYNYKESELNKNYISDADLAQEELSSDLFSARITGTLDRTYAHKMAYEISWFAEKEAAIISVTKDESLQNMLITSHQSLDTLYPEFNDFSEAK